MSYSSKYSNNVSQQNLVITSQNYTLLNDYTSIKVNLPQIVQIPTIGNTTIRLQKMYFSSTGIVPSTSDFLFIYVSNDISLYNKVLCETGSVNSTQLVATVPVIAGGDQFFLATVDSSISQELWDNQNFSSFTISITNREGVPVKFDNVKPVIQFIITTDYRDKTYDTPLLRVEQRSGR